MVFQLIAWSTLAVWIATTAMYADAGDWRGAGVSLIVTAICISCHGLFHIGVSVEYEETATQILEHTTVHITANEWYAIIIVTTWLDIAYCFWKVFL